MILLSTDSSQDLYDSRAEKLFDKYGGGDWPSILLPNGFDDAVRFGDFGYGTVIVDEEGIVRSINDHDLEGALEKVFGE